MRDMNLRRTFGYGLWIVVDSNLMDSKWIAEEMGIHIGWPGRIFVDSGGLVSEWNKL